jgi:hypothetical protein
MFVDLIRAFCAAVVAVLLPGYFWVVFLRPTRGLAERLAYSSALSMATVPLVAVLLARITHSGISLWIALASVVIVLGSGILAVVVAGAAAGSAEAIFPKPQVIRDTRALALIAVACLAALVWGVRGSTRPGWLILPILALLVLAAVLAATTASPTATPAPAAVNAATPAPTAAPATPAAATAAPAAGMPAPASAKPTLAAAAVGAAGPARGHPAEEPASAAAVGRGWDARLPGLLHPAVLGIVLALTAIRAYAPVIRFYWPSVPGLDHFSHAVMTEQMLAHGSYPTYLIYPPGFSSLSAVISRLSGVAPLPLFAVLAPALLLLTAMAAYALATRLWGPWYGLAAAALSGLVLTGAYGGFADGRYPDLVSAYFLIPMGIAALLALYQSPSLRSAALAAVLGASPVFYHSVATLYEAVILVLAAAVSLSYLLYLRRRADARMVLLALAATLVLSTCYAWLTYGFGWPIIRHAASSAAVSMVLGSQAAPSAGHLLSELSPPIVLLGVLGAALLATSLRREHRPAQILAGAMILLWCLVMYVGSRTAADGFPQRFERDLGAALSVVGGLGLGVILSSVWLAWQRAKLTPAATASLTAGVLIVLAAGVQIIRATGDEARPGPLLSPPVEAAGDWLALHNSGGTIVSTVLNKGITERATLALGGYPGLMYYGRRMGSRARSLPTAGRKPLIESAEVLEHPGSCAAAEAIARENVRYVVLYRKASQEFDLEAFRASGRRYHEVFENQSVIIYAATAEPCPASVTAGSTSG